MKYEHILETIGNTPHLRLNKLFQDAGNVWMKLERSNPGGSIKDRIAYAMVMDAEKSGLLKVLFCKDEDKSPLRDRIALGQGGHIFKRRGSS